MWSRKSISLWKCARHFELIGSFAGDWPSTSAVEARGFLRECARVAVLVVMRYRCTVDGEINRQRPGADGEFAPLPRRSGRARFGNSRAVGGRIGPAQTNKDVMKINKKIMIGSVGLALMLSSSVLFAADSEGQRGQLTDKDYKFGSDATRGGMEEVQLGELAKQKAGSQGVREFGDRMATDHQKANDDLKQIVQKKGGLIPTSLSHHENATLERLQKLSGAEFDKAYVSDMVRDHKKDVKEFEKASQSLSDPDLKAFAEKTLPTLQEHLRMAQSLEGK